jgi:hypothetical protein
MAKEQHQRYCQLMEPQTAGGDLQAQFVRGHQAAQDGDHPSWSPSTPGQESSSTLDFAGGIHQDKQWGSTCPADKVLTLAVVGPVTIPFSQLCSSLQMLGKLLIAVTFLGCAFIVFGR